MILIEAIYPEEVARELCCDTAGEQAVLLELFYNQGESVYLQCRRVGRGLQVFLAHYGPWAEKGPKRKRGPGQGWELVDEEGASVNIRLYVDGPWAKVEIVAEGGGEEETPWQLRVGFLCYAEQLRGFLSTWGRHWGLQMPPWTGHLTAPVKWFEGEGS